MGMLSETYLIPFQIQGTERELRVVKRDALLGNSFSVKVFDGNTIIHQSDTDLHDDLYQVCKQDILIADRSLSFHFGYAKTLKGGLIVTEDETELYRSFEGEFSDGGKFGKILRTSADDADAEDHITDVDEDSRDLRNWLVGIAIALIVLSILLYLGKDTTLVKAFLFKKAAIIVIVIVGVIGLLSFSYIWDRIGFSKKK